MVTSSNQCATRTSALRSCAPDYARRPEPEEMFPALDKVSANAIYPINLGDELGKPLDEPTNTSCISRGALRSMIKRVTKWLIRLIGSRSAAGCRPTSTPMGRSIFTSRTKAPMLMRKRIGCQHRRAIQPHNAALCAEKRGADGAVESAAGRQSRGANVPAGAIAEMIVQNSRPIATMCCSRISGCTAPIRVR